MNPVIPTEQLTGLATVLGADVVADREAVQSLIGCLPGDFVAYPDHGSRSGWTWTLVRLSVRCRMATGRR